MWLHFSVNGTSGPMQKDIHKGHTIKQAQLHLSHKFWRLTAPVGERKTAKELIEDPRLVIKE